MPNAFAAFYLSHGLFYAFIRQVYILLSAVFFNLLIPPNYSSCDKPPSSFYYFLSVYFVMHLCTVFSRPFPVMIPESQQGWPAGTSKKTPHFITSRKASMCSWVQHEHGVRLWLISSRINYTFVSFIWTVYLEPIPSSWKQRNSQGPICTFLWLLVLLYDYTWCFQNVTGRFRTSIPCAKLFGFKLYPGE